MCCPNDGWLTDLIQGDVMSERWADKVRVHIESCQSCSERFKEIQEVIELLRQSAPQRRKGAIDDEDSDAAADL